MDRYVEEEDKKKGGKGQRVDERKWEQRAGFAINVAVVEENIMQRVETEITTNQS